MKNENSYLLEYQIFLSLSQKIFKSFEIQNKIDSIIQKKIPIISFEGLPGTGKTTQIEIVGKYLNNNGFKCGVLELPAGNQSARLLTKLYQDSTFFNSLEKDMPWLNPFFITVQLYTMMNQFVSEGYEFIIMSRGLISTVYYHWKAFKLAGHDEDEAFDELMRICDYFIYPEYVIYLDTPIDIAYQRVIKRNRLPLRKSDTIEGLTNISLEYQKIFKKFENLERHIIDANQSIENVTTEIIKIFESHLLAKMKKVEK